MISVQPNFRLRNDWTRQHLKKKLRKKPVHFRLVRKKKSNSNLSVDLEMRLKSRKKGRDLLHVLALAPHETYFAESDWSREGKKQAGSLKKIPFQCNERGSGKEIETSKRKRKRPRRIYGEKTTTKKERASKNGSWYFLSVFSFFLPHPFLLKLLSCCTCTPKPPLPSVRPPAAFKTEWVSSAAARAPNDRSKSPFCGEEEGGAKRRELLSQRGRIFGGRLELDLSSVEGTHWSCV